MHYGKCSWLVHKLCLAYVVSDLQQSSTALCVWLLAFIPLRSAARFPIDQQQAADLADKLERALELQQQPHSVAVDVLGRNCHMPNALQTPLHTVLHQEWLLQQQPPAQQTDTGGMQALHEQDKQQVFMAAIRDALAAGGCSASRCSYAGALLGAWLGPSAVPDYWIARYDSSDNVRTWMDQICNCRGFQ
jgi:hypothetical protein